MPRTTAEKRAAFRALHQEGCFILPNPWDIGSARLFETMGFSALASTSSGFAWTQGQPDNAVTRDAVLAHLAALAEAVELPINADFESGFATAPETVAANVALAIGTGIAGLSIEDTDIETAGHLYETPLAVERIRAARQAIENSGQDVLLVARTEGLLADPQAIIPAIDKLVAFAEAGADCLYAPGVVEPDDIAAMVRAVSPKPLNVLVMRPDQRLEALVDLGVRRISVGGAIARVAWRAVKASLEEIRTGSFQSFGRGMSGGELNGIFGKFS